MKVVYGAPAELAAGAVAAIAQLEAIHGEAYVSIFTWGAMATFDNGTESETLKRISPDGAIS